MHTRIIFPLETYSAGVELDSKSRDARGAAIGVRDGEARAVSRDVAKGGAIKGTEGEIALFTSLVISYQ
jgi:hypothetical protein